GIEKMDERLNGLRKVLLRLAHQKMGELEETIRLRHVAGFRAARDMVMSDYGKQVMDQIRAISLQMGTLLSRKRDFERQLLLARERKVFAAGSVLAISIVFFWVLLYRIIGKEIETRESLLLRLKEESTHDALTGLFNRPAAMDILQHSIANAERRKWKIGVLMIDLDGFKGVNDQWGHLAGDQALVEVARRFRQVVREGDILARLGGDEFLCLMPVLEGLEGALNLGNRLLGVFRDPIQEAAFSSRLGCSIGVAVYPEDGEDPKSLLAAADRRLYAAKDKGGHSLCFKDE
ncbi:diguanylate cyclase domain-containing protein, partial [Leptospirillum ferriphilum]